MAGMLQLLGIVGRVKFSCSNTMKENLCPACEMDLVKVSDYKPKLCTNIECTQFMKPPPMIISVGSIDSDEAVKGL